MLFLLLHYFTIKQIANRMLKRQMIRVALYMLCPRKQKGVLRPIKIYLSETSWHRFQTCLQTKTLDSKVNTMYDLFVQPFHVNHLQGVFLQCFVFNEITQLSENIQQTKYHWQEIPRGELHLCTEAKKPENKVKNRYITIFPCMYITLIHTKKYNSSEFLNDIIAVRH